MARWINIAVVALTLFSFLTPFIPPDTFWLAAAFGPVVPLLILLQLLLFIFWLYQKERIAWLNFSCLVAGAYLFLRLFSFGGNTVLAPEPSLRIMTLNTHFFSTADRKWPSNDVLNVLLRDSVDLLFLQEAGSIYFSGPYVRAFTEETSLKYYYKPDGSGLLLLSRYPLSLIEQSPPKNKVNGYFVVDAETPLGTLRLVNAHLQSNAISDMADQIASDGKLQEPNTWNTIRGMFGRYARASRIRAEQARTIAEIVRKSPYPVLFGADLNDVPASYAYQQLLQSGLEDAFLEAGNGLGVTFAGNLPGLRIDYIFKSPNLRASEFRRREIPFSDHYAIGVTISN